ncbi:hypothetical protein [Tunicatimonas pelagia]|uniref:hypothetical protein n=1 Tax=Tunicatimonas pelagia TaxID=931531 RepID=UPI0026658BD6|nr:hypothetical protein [Tunicatimonas pelagia]WKN41120.1 hypothetical protein P0M28_18975 [Tunicatimonas pelagia]
MNTRKISYIELDEDYLEKEVEWALSKTMEERFVEYCKHIVRNYALAGIDVTTSPTKRTIYYLEPDET